MIGLDTNVLARYYVASDDPATQQQGLLARALLESGKALFVSKSVVLELEWALRGFYKLNTQDVLAVLQHLRSMPNVQLEDRPAVELAVQALAEGFDFADALHHASCRQCSSLATFDDKRFARKADAAGWSPAVKLLQ